VIVAIGQADGQAQAQNVGSGDLLEISRGGRSWEDVLVGFYYVKPNYPGRSSHVSVFLSNKPFITITHFNFYTRRQKFIKRSVTHGLGRFAMQVLLSPLPTGISDMERLWASRTCIMVLRSDIKQAFSIWSMQIIQGV
jgi:hypothetical protein